MNDSADPSHLAPVHGPVAPPSTEAKRDVDRRMKPSDFFKGFGLQEGQPDPSIPVEFHADQRFLQQVDADIAKALGDFEAGEDVERLFPIKADVDALGALEEFRAGESLAIARIPAEVPLLVIGDVHGDSWSLAAALCLAKEPEILRQLGVLPCATPPAVVILGDLVDRGIDHVGCVMLALERMRSHGGSTVLIAGNHDVGHRWSDEESAFVSELLPAEFADWLNALEPAEGRGKRVAFGRAFLEYVDELPRAVAFRCGLLAIHGGVPHCDIFHTLDSLEALKVSGPAKDDFTWIRVAERAPAKYPNRSRRGCELGTEQLVASVKHLSSLLEVEGHGRITAVVRGHDHHDDRFYMHRAGFPAMSLLTVNTMGAIDEGELPFVSGDLQPCIAVYAHGSVPRIVKLVRPGREPAADEGQATDAVPFEPEAADSPPPPVEVEQPPETDGQR